MAEEFEVVELEYSEDDIVSHDVNSKMTPTIATQIDMLILLMILIYPNILTS